jgi:AAA15 family ATPase/GTPase
MFKDTFIDFTYPKKNADSTVEMEFLEEFPNIKFKRVCILMGANASGKTSLGKVMCIINNHLYGRSIIDPDTDISSEDKLASFEVTYVTPDNGLIHKLVAKFHKQEGLVYEGYKVNQIYSSKSHKKTIEALEKSAYSFVFDANSHERSHGIENIRFQSALALTSEITITEEETFWNYIYSDRNSFDPKSYTPNNINFLGSVLKAFDSSISSVVAIPDAKDAFVVKFENGDSVIVDKGKSEHMDRLSRGTWEAIQVANFTSHIRQQGSGTYFIDEKMAYSHSEMEMAMINLMIEKLNDQSQLFVTTHNHDILDMNLPTHSYIFMRKDGYVKVSQPEKMGYNKNDRTLLGYVKNDVFNTVPDTSMIYDLID